MLALQMKNRELLSTFSMYQSRAGYPKYDIILPKGQYHQKQFMLSVTWLLYGSQSLPHINTFLTSICCSSSKFWQDHRHFNDQKRLESSVFMINKISTSHNSLCQYFSNFNMHTNHCEIFLSIFFCHTTQRVGS